MTASASSAAPKRAPIGRKPAAEKQDNEKGALVPSLDKQHLPPFEDQRPHTQHRPLRIPPSRQCDLSPQAESDTRS